MTKVPPELRVYQQKIERLAELEKNYWNKIREQRVYLKDLSPDINQSLEEFFPSNVSSRIYACKDGVVLVRYKIASFPSKFEVFYISEKLDNFLVHLPIPTKIGDINLGSFIRLGPGSDIRIVNCIFNDILIEWVHINSFFYTGTDEELIKFEEALTDFRLYLIGLTLDPKLKPFPSKKAEREDILYKLEKVIKDFERLLEISHKEEEIQKFLKKNPILIQPCNQIIPKQKLGEDFVTDFVLVNILDQGVIYTLVEIEKPSMRVLTKKGEFSAEFKHAERQILDWKIWIQNNQDYLQRKLKDFRNPKYLIIGGRSKNLSENEKRRIRIWNDSHKDIKFLTYDDILERAKELLKSLREGISL